MEYFSTLHVTPIASRLFKDENQTEGRAAAVISYAFWGRRFGGDPAVVRTKVRANPAPFMLVSSQLFGVGPADVPALRAGALLLTTVTVIASYVPA